ncbi:ERI1 exoribonuclease 3 [Crotalus adamanteus]|uniref:ERI1 exoribonuclease 3 n=1 Tax=Crotalus adamanteus TaxID=8729 RepID=A0AAW1BQ92_CROAD
MIIFVKLTRFLCDNANPSCFLPELIRQRTEKSKQLPAESLPAFLPQDSKLRIPQCQRRREPQLGLVEIAVVYIEFEGQRARSSRCYQVFNDRTSRFNSSKASPQIVPKIEDSSALLSRYHYFLVLDFEATCDKPQIHPQEIIEFPILKLNGRTMEIESTFHMYVQPVVHPQLTPFCTELTGIIQAMVDGQPSLQQVLERVDEWMAKEGLLDPTVKSIFVTCGDWDLKVMLPGQCQYLGLPVADYFKQWINLKKAYSFAMGSWPKNGLLDMNKGLNLQHIGRPHSGIDDCKNIANIMKTLAHRGFIFKQTSKPF